MVDVAIMQNTLIHLKVKMKRRKIHKMKLLKKKKNQAKLN